METSSLHQAAIVLVALGPQAGGKILEHLPEPLVERLVGEIRRLRHVDTRKRQDALEELHRFERESALVGGGGESLARRMLEEALGQHRAGKMLQRLRGPGEKTRCEALERAEPVTVARVLEQESPQTVAMVLAQIDPRRAGPILRELAGPLRADVALRMAVLEPPLPEFVDIVEASVTARIEASRGRGEDRRGGPRQVAAVLNQVDPDVGADILEQMREIHEETARSVQNLMFVFDDLVTLEDRYVQDLLKEIDSRELTCALKATTAEVREKIFQNMSKRASAGIQEDMEYLGPIRASEAFEAQQRIVDTLRRLERDGVVVLSGTGRSRDLVV